MYRDQYGEYAYWCSGVKGQSLHLIQDLSLNSLYYQLYVPYIFVERSLCVIKETTTDWKGLGYSDSLLVFWIISNLGEIAC